MSDRVDEGVGGEDFAKELGTSRRDDEFFISAKQYDGLRDKMVRGAELEKLLKAKITTEALEKRHKEVQTSLGRLVLLGEIRWAIDCLRSKFKDGKKYYDKDIVLSTPTNKVVGTFEDMADTMGSMWEAIRRQEETILREERAKNQELGFNNS